MNRKDTAELRRKLEKNLSADRFQHTLGVAYTAAALAMRYQASVEDAELAGLLHDCAKEYGKKELLVLGEKAGHVWSEEDMASPQLWHAIVGPYVAEQKYDVHAPQVLSAIRWHTTGKRELSLLEKIVFTADYIEPNRDKADNLAEIRHLAFEDLDDCVYRITEDTLRYLAARNVKADRKTEECYQWLKEVKHYDEK